MTPSDIITQSTYPTPNIHSNTQTTPVTNVNPTPVIWKQQGQSIVGEASGDHSGWYVALSEDGYDIDGKAAGDWTGSDLSLSADGSNIAIGAYHNDDNGDQAGRVIVYRIDEDGSSLTQLGQGIDGDMAGQALGIYVALSADGNTLVTGASGARDYAGHVRLYYMDGDGLSWKLRQTIIGEALGHRVRGCRWTYPMME